MRAARLASHFVAASRHGRVQIADRGRSLAATASRWAESLAGEVVGAAGDRLVNGGAVGADRGVDRARMLVEHRADAFGMRADETVQIGRMRRNLVRKFGAAGVESVESACRGETIWSRKRSTLSPSAPVMSSSRSARVALISPRVRQRLRQALRRERAAVAPSRPTWRRFPARFRVRLRSASWRRRPCSWRASRSSTCRARPARCRCARAAFRARPRSPGACRSREGRRPAMPESKQRRRFLVALAEPLVELAAAHDEVCSIASARFDLGGEQFRLGLDARDDVAAAVVSASRGATAVAQRIVDGSAKVDSFASSTIVCCGRPMSRIRPAARALASSARRVADV